MYNFKEDLNQVMLVYKLSFSLQMSIQHSAIAYRIVSSELWLYVCGTFGEEGCNLPLWKQNHAFLGPRLLVAEIPPRGIVMAQSLFCSSYSQPPCRITSWGKKDYLILV